MHTFPFVSRHFSYLIYYRHHHHHHPLNPHPRTFLLWGRVYLCRPSSSSFFSSSSSPYSNSSLFPDPFDPFKSHQETENILKGGSGGSQRGNLPRVLRDLQQKGKKAKVGALEKRGGCVLGDAWLLAGILATKMFHFKSSSGCSHAMIPPHIQPAMARKTSPKF